MVARREAEPDPVGVVLAGGESRRMGRDKATLPAPGGSLPGRAALLLASVCPEVVLADRGRGLIPELRSLGDGPGSGPAAGILGAALAFPGRSLLVLAGDLPEVPVALLAELARPSGFDWVVPRWQGRLEPLCALYREPALAALADLVARGSLAPQRLAEVPGLSVRYLGSELLARFGHPERIFVNLNTPEELARWEAQGEAEQPA
ncbi:MAG TPA: NTP transferase domain-containing protein [Thermoanaerobaculia bacterium]|nr:NTP transferase domain-containing protein [Thermoanaerobaculia bacterium]